MPHGAVKDALPQIVVKKNVSAISTRRGALSRHGVAPIPLPTDGVLPPLRDPVYEIFRTDCPNGR
jgi:hypothetical protein